MLGYEIGRDHSDCHESRETEHRNKCCLYKVVIPIVQCIDCIYFSCRRKYSRGKDRLPQSGALSGSQVNEEGRGNSHSVYNASLGPKSCWISPTWKGNGKKTQPWLPLLLSLASSMSWSHHAPQKWGNMKLPPTRKRPGGLLGNDHQCFLT